MFVCKSPLDSMIKFSSTVGERGRSEDNEEVEGPTYNYVKLSYLSAVSN